MNVNNINQKTTSDTGSSSNPDLVLVGRVVHEGTHRHDQRKDTYPTSSQPLTQDIHTVSDNTVDRNLQLNNGSAHPRKGLEP